MRGAFGIVTDAELRPLSPRPHIMAMPALRQFTIAEVEDFPEDGNRYELLDGVLLVTPQAGLQHQDIATQIAAELATALRPEPEVRVWAPGAIRMPPLTMLEPDILVGRRPPVLKWEAVPEHWLAVEVMGIGSKVYDREYKRDAYLALGVREVWLVDLRGEKVFVSRAGGPKDDPHDGRLIWRTPGGRECRIDIPALFTGVPRGE